MNDQFIPGTQSPLNLMFFDGSVCESAIDVFGECLVKDLLFWRWFWLKRGAD